jgi:prepilin-type N-terminal cleavage/methylation domain-containing protein
MIFPRARFMSSARMQKGIKRSGLAKAGFSMLELTLVVGIIGVLSMAAVPSFQVAVEQTRVDRGVGELQSMWIAQRLHFLESGRFAKSLMELTKAELWSVGKIGKTEGFEFKILPSYRGEWRLQAKRTSDSSWTGEIYLDKHAHLQGEIISDHGDVVNP